MNLVIENKWMFKLIFEKNIFKIRLWAKILLTQIHKNKQKHIYEQNSLTHWQEDKPGRIEMSLKSISLSTRQV